MLPLNMKDIELFIFDFDGVMTNNNVYIDAKGNELVQCNRSDGLAFDALRKLNKKSYIISTETNAVVDARAKKLKIEALTGVSDKEKVIKNIAILKNFDLNKIFYVGNDLNDYLAIKLCGYTACPSNSHSLICKNVNYVLKKKGGEGVVLEILEDIFNIDLIKLMYQRKL